MPAGDAGRWTMPFAVAATGPRGPKLAARYGQVRVITGDPKVFDPGTLEQSRALVLSELFLHRRLRQFADEGSPAIPRFTGLSGARLARSSSP